MAEHCLHCDRNLPLGEAGYCDDCQADVDDGGANEGPSFESSMRAKYPVQQSPLAKPGWADTFNDRRRNR